MHYQLKIPGAYLAGTLNVYSPYDGELVGSVETIDEKGVDQALKNAATIFRDRKKWLPAKDRIAILEKVVMLMQEQSGQLVKLAIAEGGKPYRDTAAELDSAIESIKLCAECIRTEQGQEIPMGINQESLNKLAFTHLEPLGPVVAMSAFYHPLLAVAHQIGPAVASGCPIIIKPAKDTPLSTFALADIFFAAGLPNLWCQPIMVSDTATSAKLVADQRVAFFSFIGKADLGWLLRSNLAPGTRCALEHGGPTPVIIARDSDPKQSIKLLAKGGYYHAGQNSISVQKVFAHRSMAKKIALQLAEFAEKMTLGDPASQTTDIGPIIRAKEVERIEEWINEALLEKGEVISGGKIASGNIFQPTVLFNPTDNCTISQREVLGPVICVYEYDQLDHAVERINDQSFAFQASIITQNLDTALYAYKNLNASAVMINEHSAFRTNWMPFAGLQQSGYQTWGIPFSYRSMHYEKTLVINSKNL